MKGIVQGAAEAGSRQVMALTGAEGHHRVRSAVVNHFGEVLWHNPALQGGLREAAEGTLCAG